MKIRDLVLKNLILVSLLALCAADKANINGSWQHNEYMCEADWGRQPCTKEQLKAIKSEFEQEKKENPDLKYPNQQTCGRGFTLAQFGNKICGVWNEGCSFGQVGMGYIVATKKGNKIIGKMGENIQNETPNFPNQKSENFTLIIEKNGDLKDYQTYKKDKINKPITKDDLQLDEDDNFYNQCKNGIDFK